MHDIKGLIHNTYMGSLELESILHHVYQSIFNTEVFFIRGDRFAVASTREEPRTGKGGG